MFVLCHAQYKHGTKQTCTSDWDLKIREYSRFKVVQYTILYKMEVFFDQRKYIKCLGEELVSEFERAGMMTHPGAIGSGREQSAKQKLKLILPSGIGIGSGFVIDSYGNVSKQCDVVLYEENFALRFNPNNDSNNIYYNCESVIAVGEIKSDVSKKELLDSIQKLRVIKSLNRRDDGRSFRKYFSSQAVDEILGPGTRDYNVKESPYKQIYTFLLCKDLNVKTAEILDLLKNNCEGDWEYPNRIISTSGAYVGYLKSPNQLKPSRIDASEIFNMVDNDYTFNFFVNDLIQFIINATTVCLNYQDYLQCNMTTNMLKERFQL